MKDFCNLDPKAILTLDQAVEIIRQHLPKVHGQEQVGLQKALGRTLAKAVYSSIDIPSQRTSAMDGYAFSSTDILHNQAFTLMNIGVSWAGKPFEGNVKTGQCVRIFTGAVVPDNTDSVIIQECVDIDGNRIHFPPDTKGLQNIRRPGEEISRGLLLLSPPALITANDCALLASAGINEISVKRKLRIAYLSTGDELTPLGQILQSGQIYESNRYALAALLNDESYSVSDLGAIKDAKKQLKHTLQIASQNHDVVITTGGASVGDADLIHAVLDKCGQVIFWKIAMKPGKPFIFGKIGHCLIFGLPGNPVSVVVTYQKIVQPALRQMTGAPLKKPLRISARSTTSLRKSPGRMEYQRGWLTQFKNGEFIVEPAGRQESHHLTTLCKANCYIVLPLECAGVTAGDAVLVEPFDRQI